MPHGTISTRIRETDYEVVSQAGRDHGDLEIVDVHSALCRLWETSPRKAQEAAVRYVRLNRPPRGGGRRRREEPVPA